MFKKFVKKQFMWLFFIVIFCQAFLISHRVSFEFSIFFNFYKENIAIEKSIKNKSAIKISKFLNQVNLKNFYIDKSLINNDNFSQRLVEYAYPIKFDEDSRYIISRNKIDNCSKIFEYKDKYVFSC